MTSETMKHSAVAQPADTPRWRERWGEIRAQFARPELGFDWLRVYLGIGLVVRGALFARDPALLEQFVDQSGWFFPMVLGHGVVLSHIVGGLMLALGLCTRWAAAVQLPFVAGALFFVHLREGLLASTQSLEFAALVMIMLLAYLICGAGDFSMDQYLRRSPPEEATGEPALSLQRSLHYQQPHVPYYAGASLPENGDLERESLRAELTGNHLVLPTDSPKAREKYRDLKRELATVLVSTGVLFVLLLQGAYVAAAAWLIAVLVMLTIWQVAQAPLGE